MASNLNKAFMRAYAKDSGRSTADQAAAVPENARPAATAPSQPPPADVVQQLAARAAMTRQQPGTQPAGPAPIASPHFSNQPPAPAQVISGRYAQKTTPAVDPATVTEAASVWQRIDAAHATQPPHTANPPSRPIAASVGVGAASGPKRMVAGAAAPAARTAQPADLREPQSVEMPLLADEPNALLADPEAVENRRRTVADFLYSAGKISGSAASPARTAAARTPVSATTAVSASSAPVTSGQVVSSFGRANAATVERSSAAAASTVHSPLYAASSDHAMAAAYASVHAPVKQFEPEALPTSMHAPATQAPLSRTGQILRVDAPKPARPSDTPLDRDASSVQQSIDRSMPDEATKSSHVAAAPVGVAGQQRQIDRAYELSEAEQKLRRSKHKIFNPVWEVDSLQWPGVCDKLMEHRAESMAQVAAHLKAACQDGLNILGVTSPASGEGRTTVACCLARLAASHGLNVALIDLDLDHPTLCLQTNLEVEHDWRDCLDGDIALEDVAVHSIDDQLTLLPLKDRSDRPELLASDMGIADMLRELSESFELVIVDACRMNSSGNVLSGLAAAQIFDAAIVVVDRRNSHQERIEDAVRALQQTGVGSIGIVDNFSM